MPTTRMGFEGMVYEGVAGSTASNLIQNAKDITESYDTGMGETTVRGDSSVPPIECEAVTSRKYSLEFNTTFKSTDTVVAAMLAAAATGTPLAFRTKSYSSGLGVDMDMNVKWKWGKPLAGSQTIDWTLSPNNDSRTPLFNV